MLEGIRWKSLLRPVKHVSAPFIAWGELPSGLGAHWGQVLKPVNACDIVGNTRDGLNGLSSSLRGRLGIGDASGRVCCCMPRDSIGGVVWVWGTSGLNV